MSVSLKEPTATGYFNKNARSPFGQRVITAPAKGIGSMPGSSELHCATKQMNLTRKESKLLSVLFQMNSDVIAERDLVEKAWKCEYDEGASHYMLVYFRRLRAKLKNYDPALKLTRQRWRDGVGYKLTRELVIQQI